LTSRLRDYHRLSSENVVIRVAKMITCCRKCKPGCF
jgi:hypothetical protein